jgi:hypothetical protein
MSTRHIAKTAAEEARTFERPHRPLGIRLFNTVGRWSWKLGVRPRPLNEQSLLDAARRRTGLTDFGDEGFREPLRVLLRAYEEESELNAFGRKFAGWSVLVLLCNRLRVQQQIAAHPEILDQPVRRPLFVLGLPRTGTTLLYNLLACDPKSRPLLMWEAIAPASRPGEEGKSPDPRIRRTSHALRLLRRLAPDLSTIHPVTADGPEECSRLLLNTFVTMYAVMENHVPSYQQWLLGQPPAVLEAAYRDYYRQLQVLQWQRPPRGHWVLKSPVHLFALHALLTVFPDAAVVQLHRDPHKVVPSLCSLFAVYQGMASDRTGNRQLGAEVLELCVEGLRRGLDAREAVEPGRVYDLRYTDLMADPIAAIRTIYKHFGYDSNEEFYRAAARWHRDNPQHKHGKHRYDLDQFGLTGAMIERAMGPYCRQYGIEPEGRPKACTADALPVG